MSTNYKVNIDLSQPRAEMEALKKVMSNLKIGGDIGKTITEEMKKLETHLQKMASQKIDIKSSPEALKQYLQGYRELENMQKSINMQLQQELQTRLQARGLTVNIVKDTQEIVNKIQAKLNIQKEDLRIAQQLQRISIEGSRDIDKKVQNAAKELELAKQTLATRTSEETINKQEDVVNKRQKVYDQLLKQQREYHDYEKKIEAIKRIIAGIEVDLSINKNKLESYDKEIKLIQEIEMATKNGIEARKKDLQVAKEKVDVIETEKTAHAESQTKIAAGVENLINKMKRLAEFTIAAFAVRYIRQFVTQGLQFIQQLDKALTEIATVTGKTREEMWGMADEFNRMGRELGKTTLEITKASVIFYRQGLSTNEVLQMVRASTISAAIANTDAAEASNRLTAALRGYGMAADQAMSIADKLAALAAKSASSFDELSYSMTKTAASAAVAGISVDHLYALVV